MKKIINFTLVNSLFITICFSQSATKDEYIKKAQTQNGFAWLLALSGTALHIAGFAIESSVPLLDLNATPEEQKSNRNKAKTADILLITGAVAFVGCIPLFISSHFNHKKSLKVAFDMKPFNQLKAGNMYASGYPALTLKVGM